MPDIIRYLYAVVSACAILSLLQRYHWTLDLLSHFQFPYLFLGGAGIVIGFSYGSWRLVLLATLLTGVSAFSIGRIYQRPLRSVTGTTIRLLQFNIRLGNRRWEAFHEYLLLQDPDIVSLQEVSLAWADALARELPQYPYKIVETRQDDHDNFGIALLSKVPLENPRIIYSTPKRVPSIFADIHAQGGSLQLVVTRPTPPFRRHWFKYQRTQFDEVAAQIDSELPCAIVGDLNSTPFAVHFRRLRKRTRTRPSYIGVAPKLTWPAELRLFGLLPIDHVLHSRGVAISHVETGPFLGSDHFPLLATIMIGKAQK